MGANLPRPKQAMIEWVQTRAPIWSASPAQVGLTDSQAAQVAARVAAARAAQLAALEARAAALAATQAYDDAIEALHTSASEAIAIIKAFAEASDDPAPVYSAAMVSAPAGQGAPRRPAEVGAVTTQLRNDGAVELRWTMRSPTPTGTRYTIYRRIAGEQAFALIADTSRKRFIDAGVPAGSLAVTYSILAKRGDFASAPSEQVTMPLGAQPAPAAAAALRAAA